MSSYIGQGFTSEIEVEEGAARLLMTINRSDFVLNQKKKLCDNNQKSRYNNVEILELLLYLDDTRLHARTYSHTLHRSLG